jgi:hypothetical protein
MKIINYIGAQDVFVEFQDQYKAIVHTSYRGFENGHVKNPYYPAVYGVGMVGQKYKTRTGDGDLKEYGAWHLLLQRCYDEKMKRRHPHYQDTHCCDDWLLFENFYEWLHSQSNFEKWLNGNRWALDKDIIYKHNKQYTPELCCLVPCHVNSLFTRRDKDRGNCPIGVYYFDKRGLYKAQCNNPFQNNKRVGLGYYSNPEDAFEKYKEYKERIIKEVARDEYEKGNITQKCFEAMMNYQVEIED